MKQLIDSSIFVSFFKQKYQTFTCFCFFNLMICCFSVSFLFLNVFLFQTVRTRQRGNRQIHFIDKTTNQLIKKISLECYPELSYRLPLYLFIISFSTTNFLLPKASQCLEHLKKEDIAPDFITLISSDEMKELNMMII